MAAANYRFVVFGATSFVGQILVKYLLEHLSTQPEDARPNWAIAGRSEAKLQALKHKLGENATDLPHLVADSNDEDSLAALCAQTDAVVPTVGPYALYGEPLVRHCAKSGTHYCDLTGEPQWMYDMIHSYQEDAQASGAMLVHCCGFDSIPSDLGLYFLQQQAKSKFGVPCANVKMRVKAAKGGLSGGTFASMLNILKDASQDRDLRKLLQNPYMLCPEREKYSARQQVHKGADFDRDFQRWTAPFIMEAVNSRVVHRSNALLGDQYGKPFFYDEAMLCKTAWPPI